MSDTFEFEDKAKVDRLIGTLHDPAATPGDVLTVQADKSIAAAPGGGSMPGAWYFADIVFNEPTTWTSYAITAVDTDAGTFTITGDHTADFPEGSLFGVAGSTGNDSFYHVQSVAFAAGHTTIATANGWMPTDPTVDGAVVKSLVATLHVPAGSAVLDMRAFGGTTAFRLDSYDATWQIGDSRDANAYSGSGDPDAGEARQPAYDPTLHAAASIGTDGFTPGIYGAQQVFLSSGAAADGVHYPDGDNITCRIAACIGVEGGNGQTILRFLISAPTDPIVAS